MASPSGLAAPGMTHHLGVEVSSPDGEEAKLGPLAPNPEEVKVTIPSTSPHDALSILHAV